MRKAGIFTIYLANYGAVLQTYALQHYIRKNVADIDVTVVDFYSHKPYNIFKKASNNPLKNILKQCLKLFHLHSLLKRNIREKDFIRKEFSLSRRFSSINDFMNNIPDYDFYLTGSDQVFNFNSPYRSLFYQQFPISHGIRAAYAPSFGISNFSREFGESIAPDISKFDFLSCRENDGAKFLTKITGKHVPCVVDPTLLLSKDEWESIMIPPSQEYNYLLIYDLNGGQRLVNLAIPIAQKLNLKIWCITQHTYPRYKGVNKLIFDAGPREFVGLFAKAQYVITDSFHGTCFSIIFNKPFNTFVALPKASARITSLLVLCNLESRIIGEEDLADSDQLDASCEPNTYFPSLDELSFYSKEYLNSIFNN